MDRGRLLLKRAHRGNEMAQDALLQAGYSLDLSPQIQAGTIQTAVELYADAVAESDESGREQQRESRPALARAA